jgi:inward rectifier potassium channel
MTQPPAATSGPPRGAVQNRARRKPGAGSFERRLRRTGVPQRPLDDAYAALLAEPWWRFFLWLLTAFLVTNLLFASLYRLDPGGVLNARPGSFTDAWFFSVQTLATIGYGYMAPVSLYAHLVVSLEALVGLLGLAVTTGLTFARISRPQARVVFSEVAVVGLRNGRPYLQFRLANVRDAELVDARIRATVLLEHVTAEGERMRKMHDLVFERDSTPLFMVSWLVLHPLDEHSPLFGYDLERLEREQVRIIVALTGLDAGFTQTVYARFHYDAQHILFNARFVDALQRAEDGSLHLAVDRLHETEVVVSGT